MRDRIDGVMRRRIGGLLATGALIVGSVVGCSGGSGEPDSLRHLLDQAPDGESSRSSLIYGNLARLRGDRAPTDPESDAKALFDASGGPMVVWPVQTGYADPGLVDEAGFDITEIDASLHIGAPPTQMSVFAGRFDADRVGRSLTETAPFADQVEAGEAGEIATYKVGEEGENDPDRASLLRPVGEALRIGVTEESVRFASDDAGFNRLLELADGSSGSLGEDATYRWGADLIDEAEAHTALLMGDPDKYGFFEPPPNTTPAQAEAIQERIDAGEIGLVRWEFAALADTTDGLLILLDHSDEATAEKNAERLERIVKQGQSMVTGQPWSDLLKVNSIETDGDKVVANLAAERPLALQVINAHDSLVMIVETDG